MPRGTRYSQETKAAVLEDTVKKGIHYVEAARAHGIPAGTVWTWYKDATKSAKRSAAAKRIWAARKNTITLASTDSAVITLKKNGTEITMTVPVRNLTEIIQSL